MTEISGQFRISGQFQDNYAILGISGLLGPLEEAHITFGVIFTMNVPGLKLAVKGRQKANT